MSYSSTRFTVDELGFIQTALTKVLSAAAAGELDLNRLAREELAPGAAVGHGGSLRGC